jgi:hypothetical protein
MIRSAVTGRSIPYGESRTMPVRSMAIPPRTPTTKGTPVFTHQFHARPAHRSVSSDKSISEPGLAPWPVDDEEAEQDSAHLNDDLSRGRYGLLDLQLPDSQRGAGTLRLRGVRSGAPSRRTPSPVSLGRDTRQGRRRTADTVASFRRRLSSLAIRSRPRGERA